TVVDERAQPAHGSGHHRRAARGCLERDETEGLGPAGHEADVGGSVVARQQMMRLWIDEAHPRPEPELYDEVAYPLELRRAVGPAGAADHEQDGVLLVERGQRAYRHFEALQRLDAADEEQDRALGRSEAQRGAGAAAAPGREEGVVDAGRHDLDA